jgi:hypothetical protein
MFVVLCKTDASVDVCMGTFECPSVITIRKFDTLFLSPELDLKLFILTYLNISRTELNEIASSANHVLLVSDHLNLHLPLQEIRCGTYIYHK